MTPLRWLALLGIAVAAGSLWLPLAHSDENDHELARQALQQGKVLPLRTVLDQVERDYQGQVVKVEFEHDDGHFVYELRLLHPNGQLSKLEIDAVTGKVLRLRKKEHD
ncbi:MAG: PepSY domain-containing protein [Comamonas sp.]|nr:PepSY domain-containing protein [Candidatus Comamonas equi]